ncbi:MAG: hypothetical protein VKP70_07110 [Cyanobacteriota bacterium]|nr:hypothetical protein [Cyanobacteriota bacterium]
MRDGESTQPQPRWHNGLDVAFLVISLLISVLIILKGSGVVPKPLMDQHFVETVDLHLRWDNGTFSFQYPNLMHSGGITSSLIAGIYKLIIPTTPSTLNWHFKIFAMASCLVSSFFLLRTALPRALGLRILGFLIIATSGYQLLEPSSDVISAALLNLFFIAVLRRWSKLFTAFVLATFALCKVELILGATALALLWFAWEWKRGADKPYLAILLPALFLSLYLAPAFVLTGSNPLTSDRSSTAFFSAYRDFMRLHQFQLVPPTDQEADQAMRSTLFRDAPTFRDVLRQRPDLYFDYVGVSAARSLPNMIKVFKFMLIPFLLILSQVKSIQQHRFLLIGSALIATCILLPSWLVIFVRMRYIAKVLPVVTTATIACALELAARRKIYLKLTWLCGISTLAWQVASLTPYQD